MTANRFKFRIWDTIEKYMSTPEMDNFAIRQDGKITNFEGEELLDSLMRDMDQERFVIMQSTGLLDKNGKEIFEGDILSPPNCTTHKQWIDVKWEEKSARFYFGKLFFRAQITECEIVGNPYENPLLPMERYC